MSRSRPAVVLFASFSLLAGASAALAEPGHGKGGNPHRQAPHENHAGHGDKRQMQGHGDHDPGRYSGYRGDYLYPGRIDEERIRRVLDDNRGYWNPGAALPPGIQKRLARGKPLPPGIATRLDGRLYGRLPYYDGYEWMQAGTELILVGVATGVIHEVVHDIFH